MATYDPLGSPYPSPNIQGAQVGIGSSPKVGDSGGTTTTLADGSPYTWLGGTTGTNALYGSSPNDVLSAFANKASPTSANFPQLIQGFTNAGYSASPYMYGSTPSNNEITLNGEKYKVISGESGSNPSWYYGGNDSAGGGGGSAAPSNMNYQQALQYLGLQANDPRISQLFQMFGGTPNDTFTAAGLAPVQQYLQSHGGTSPYGYAQQDNPGGPGYAGGGGGGYGSPSAYYPGTNVFNDPATAPFEQLLNQRITQLLQNWMPPDAGNTIDFLKNYQARLTGSPYTPAQMDLIQTQAIDPLTRQRDAQKQQAIQYGASHGMSPDSGPVQTMLNNIDRSYDQNTTAARAGFASNAIGLDNQNWATAAGIGPQIMSLEQQMFGNQEARNNQAVNLANIIPTMAWNRLMGSNQTVQPINPASLLTQLQSFQQQGYNQGSDFAGGLASILPYLIQLIPGLGSGSGSSMQFTM